MLVVIMCFFFFFPIWHVVPLELELAHICHVSIGARRGHSFKREEWRQARKMLAGVEKAQKHDKRTSSKKDPGKLVLIFLPTTTHRYALITGQ